MRSLLDDIVTTLSNTDFSIPNVQVRLPYGELPKSYPIIVIHEVSNTPLDIGSVTGELTNQVAYQFDIHTQNCTDIYDNVLNAFTAGRMLLIEVDDVMQETFKFTRSNIRSESTTNETVIHTLRGECILSSDGYAYRP